MFNGVLERQHAMFALRLATHIAVLLVHADHDACMGGGYVAVGVDEDESVVRAWMWMKV